MNVIDISGLDYNPSLELLTSYISEKKEIIMQIDFGADHKESKVIRDFVGIIFDEFHIGNPWKGRFVLITDELINNAIEHGSLPGDMDSCVIEAKENEKGEFSITIEVHDTGKGKDAKDATHMGEIKKEKLSRDSTVYMEKRGRGLFYITEKIVDRLSFSESPRGGLAVKVEKNIAPILPIQ